MTKSTKIYIVSAFSMEPYSDGQWPVKGFYTREEAAAFIESNPEVYDADPDNYEDGWKYASWIQEIELDDEIH